MKVIKRDGHVVEYCPEKIENAIKKANAEVEEEEQATLTQIRNIIKLSIVKNFNIFHTMNKY